MWTTMEWRGWTSTEARETSGAESTTFVLRDLSRYFSIKLLGTRRASPPSKLRHRRNDGRPPSITSRDRSRARPRRHSRLSLSLENIFRNARRKSSTVDRWCERASSRGAISYSVSIPRQNAVRDFSGERERKNGRRRVVCGFSNNGVATLNI